MPILNRHSTKSDNKGSKHTSAKLLLASLLVFGLIACDDSTTVSPLPESDMEQVIEEMPVVEEPMEYSYTITLTNLTYGQPLSPVAAMFHDEGKLWMVGESASLALEKLAEGGDNSELISLATNMVTAMGEAPVGPGASDTLTLTTIDYMPKYLSVVSMLVNTNDAFSGLTGVDISTLEVDQAKSWMLNVYDAGTESNSEMAGTIPGPADGGTGYDATRDDIDMITMHPGVVSQDDGLSDSVLTQAHRFDNPAVKVTIMRTK